MPTLRPGLQNPAYLGDGVYVARDSYDPTQVWVFLSNGLEYGHYIALGPRELETLVNYAQRAWSPPPAAVHDEDSDDADG